MQRNNVVFPDPEGPNTPVTPRPEIVAFGVEPEVAKFESVADVDASHDRRHF